MNEYDGNRVLWNVVNYLNLEIAEDVLKAFHGELGPTRIENLMLEEKNIILLLIRLKELLERKPNENQSIKS